QTQSAGGAFLVGGCEQVLLGQGGCPLRLLRKGAGKDAGDCCNTQQQALEEPDRRNRARQPHASIKPEVRRLDAETRRSRILLPWHGGGAKPVTDDFPGALDAFFEAGGVAPAETVQQADVQQLAGRAVWLGGIEDQGAVEIEHAGDDLGQLADRDLLAGANVDERRRILGQQGTESGIVQVHQKATSLGEIVGVEKFASRRASAPDDNLLRTGGFGFSRFANERRENMRVGQIEVVVGTVQVRRHCGEIASAILAVVAPAHLDSRNLGDCVGAVGRLQRPGQQVVFPNRLGAEPGVDAGGAKEEQAFHPGIAAGLDQVGLDDEVVADKVGWGALVGENAADPGCGKEDKLRLFVGNKLVYSDLIAEIEILVRAGEQVVVSKAQEFAMNCRSDQAAMAGDVDAAVQVHKGLRAG